MTIPAGLTVDDTTVDLLVVGSGTGMAAALAAHEAGLSVLIVEKSAYVGGSTARSGGALWLPASPVLREAGAGDSAERAQTYLRRGGRGHGTGRTRPRAFVEQHDRHRRHAAPHHADEVLLGAGTTPTTTPRQPGGSAAGRTCECRPLNTSILGAVPAATAAGRHGGEDPHADHRRRLPLDEPDGPGAAKGLADDREATRPRASAGCCSGRRYAAGGQALAAGLFAGVLRAGIPIWTDTALVDLVDDGDRVTGAVVDHGGRRITVTARRGVVLAAGGFDHSMDMRWKFQSESLGSQPQPRRRDQHRGRDPHRARTSAPQSI